MSEACGLARLGDLRLRLRQLVQLELQLAADGHPPWEPSMPALAAEVWEDSGEASGHKPLRQAKFRAQAEAAAGRVSRRATKPPTLEAEL